VRVFLHRVVAKPVRNDARMDHTRNGERGDDGTTSC
jgi:hypothetical protein